MERLASRRPRQGQHRAQAACGGRGRPRTCGRPSPRGASPGRSLRRAAARSAARGCFRATARGSPAWSLSQWLHGALSLYKHINILLARRRRLPGMVLHQCQGAVAISSQLGNSWPAAGGRYSWACTRALGASMSPACLQSRRRAVKAEAFPTLSAAVGQQSPMHVDC